MQNLRDFKVPAGFRGASLLKVQLWWFIQSSLFSWSPQGFYKWRALLLRIFGAKIGTGVIIRPSVTITYPWHLSIGNYSWIGDGVVLYSLGRIDIGSNSVISQKSYLCTGSHDYKSENFDIYSEPIIIGNKCWLATDVFVAPGVNIKNGSIIGARSSVFTDIDENSICMGNPAKKIRERD